MVYFRNYVILYLKKHVYQYIFLYFTHVLYGCLVWSYSNRKRCIRIITYSEFTQHTGPLFSKLKLLKVKDIFPSTKLLFIFDFINENVPEKLKTIFVINRSYTHMKLAPQWCSTYQKLKCHALV